MNCEDIAMNFVIANYTGKAPIKVSKLLIAVCNVLYMCNKQMCKCMYIKLLLNFILHVIYVHRSLLGKSSNVQIAHLLAPCGLILIISWKDTSV